jgi:hypothetical protein
VPDIAAAAPDPRRKSRKQPPKLKPVINLKTPKALGIGGATGGVRGSANVDSGD